MLWDTTLGRQFTAVDVGVNASHFSTGLGTASAGYFRHFLVNYWLGSTESKTTIDSTTTEVPCTIVQCHCDHVNHGQNSTELNELTPDPRIRRVHEVLANGSSEEGRDEGSRQFNEAADRDGDIAFVMENGLNTKIQNAKVDRRRQNTI